MRQLGLFVVVVALAACGGEEPKKSSTSAAAKKAPDARMTKSLAQAARTRSMPTGARPADPRALQLGGKPVAALGEGDMAWLVSEDLDGDRRAEDVLVVLEAASERVYLLWSAPLEGCADSAAGILVAIDKTGAFEVIVAGSCADASLLAGCAFTAAGACDGCGVCAVRQGALACAASDACE